MKSNKLVTFLTVVGLALPAQARLADSADTVSSHQKVERSTWQKLESVARVKVREILSFFKKPTPTETKPTVSRSVASHAEPENIAATAESAESSPAPVIVNAPVLEAAKEEQKQFADVIQQTREAIGQKEAISVADPGRAGTSVLPKTKGGVPTFALEATETKKTKSGKKKIVVVKVDKIPQLDIGIERTISKNDFVPTDAEVGFKIRQKVTALDSPKLASNKELQKVLTRKVPVVSKATPPKRGEFQLGQIVTQKKIDDVSIEMKVTIPLADMKPYDELSRDKLNMVMAVIFYKKKDKCHLASGLLYELAEKKELAEEANFYLGVCAHQMGFHSEAVSRLLRVVEAEHSEYTKEAITNLVEDLPREHDRRVAAAIKSLKNKNLIEDAARDNVNFVLARAAHAQNAFGETVTYAEKVSEKSPRYVDARYLYGIGLYGLRKAKESEAALLKLREWMSKNGKSEKNIEALIAVNLARMRFTQKRYQAAHEEYMRVPKDSPHWVQALVEQGWVQLSVDDPEGAIGNMYSLHSPYFKSVFMPESWVVRTIGYIDICQYGDAYRTLSRLEHLHGSWQAAVERYLKSKKKPEDYYTTVKNYIRGRSDADIDGLPHQVIREIARQRGFLNAQGAINVVEDEIAQYNFIYSILKKDQSELMQKVNRAKARIAELRANVQKTKTNPELLKNLNEWLAQTRNEESLVKYYQFQSSLYERARLGFVKMRSTALARIDRDKSKLRSLAGRELMSHLKDIQARIEQIVEGNEFLRYEIFSGSGENIRYQVAGGSTADAKRIPANVKPQKILNWEFDGEYWEDEIGSYRSTLKNNCPKSSRTTHAAGTGYDKTAKN